MVKVNDGFREAAAPRRREKLGLGKGAKPAGSKKWSHQDWLESLVGRRVVVGLAGDADTIASGTLLHVDQYSILLGHPELEPTLFFKGGIESLKPAERG